jgi:hypothetical protein
MSPIPRRRLKNGGLAALFVLAAFAAVPALASAATVTVNTTADNAPAPGQCEGAAADCSLRQAIDVADGEPGSTTVVVPAGQYDLTVEPTGSDDNDSGDLNVKGEVRIEGAGARKTIIDAGGIEDRVLTMIEGELDLSGLTVTGGVVEGNGGGIWVEEGKATLDEVAVTENESFNEARGGGIQVENGGQLVVHDSVISGNRTSGDGGGIAYYGEESLVIENSTIADNVVDTRLNTLSNYGAYGGGMESNGELLVLRNDTFAGNQIIDTDGSGAGAAMETEFDNYEVVNTIVADNTGTDVDDPRQCSNTVPVPSLGHNLETAPPAGEPRCFEAPTDLVADPLLGPLANNGGETDTMAIATGSPAIDAGDSALCLPTDQRGVARPIGSGCDIGAFEYAPPPPAPPPPATTTALGSFVFKGVKLNRKKGTAQLKVSFTGSGKATLSGKGVKKATKTVKTDIVKLPVVPTGKAKKALTETGKAKVKVTVTFKTTANTVKKARSIVLKLK